MEKVQLLGFFMLFTVEGVLWVLALFAAHDNWEEVRSCELTLTLFLKKVFLYFRQNLPDSGYHTVNADFLTEQNGIKALITVKSRTHSQ